MAQTQASKISPAQAAQNFAQMTRQNYQSLPAISAKPEGTQTFSIPKVRLTSKIRVLIEAIVKVTHATASTYVPHPMGAYNLLRKIAVDMNNGFSPFSVSGSELYLYSLVNDNASLLTSNVGGRGKIVQGLSASPTGANNTVRMLVDLPLTLNDRDPIGLVLTQNQETTVNITMDFNKASSLLKDATGFTVELGDITITPMVESFTIPALSEAFPDLSVLKLVMASKQTISGGGQQTFKFPTGQTYRKIVVYIEDTNGGVSDASLIGNLEIVFNQADTPYRVNAKTLAGINHEQFGVPLPAGVYVFDFSYAGQSNYGGSRDYIDTESLTEMWFQFNSSGAGNITVVYETLTRLRNN